MDKPLLTTKSQPEIHTICNDSHESYVYKEPSLWTKLVYDVFLWLITKIFGGFFREIRTRGGYKVPTSGPIIVVAAPHANQFVDPIILMGQVKKTVNKRVSFLIAEKSLKSLAIGSLARCAMTIGVIRPQDNLKPAQGKIQIDPDSPRIVTGINTKFTDFEPKGMIGLPKSLGSSNIERIESDTKLILRKEFKMQKPEIKNILMKGTPFKYASPVNQSKVYHHVFEHLAHGQCVGIFPEGGSHDRTNLLPLKAGVAIMALGCMEMHPDVNVKIVPCGMNYFHPHKFRSRAVVEFGEPIEIDQELVTKYKNPETNREAVKELLDTINEGLNAVTVSCSDYETLMVVQACRRLYAGHLSSKLPLALVVEMNRRLVKCYETFKDDPRILQLKSDILKYNDLLRSYNIPDHQVETATINFTKNVTLLLFRSMRLLVSLILALPGIIMFSPVFILAKRISKQKAAKALAESSVKIKANDVVATWKILIGMGFAPLLYTVWSLLITWYFRNSITKNKFFSFIVVYICCVIVTYSALIIGDIGMDIFKSLRPLYLSVTTPKGLQSLQQKRRVLAEKITNLINVLGPQLYPDFDAEMLREKYLVSERLFEDGNTMELRRRRMLKKKKEEILFKKQEENSRTEEKGEYFDQTEEESDAVSFVNSDNSLSNIPLFSGIKCSSSCSSLVSLGSGFEIDEVTANTEDLSNMIANAVREQRK